MIKSAELVAIKERGNLVLGVVLEDKGKKLVFLSEDNKKGNIPPEKIEMKLNQQISLAGKDFEIARSIKDFRNKFEEKSLLIDLKELYELLHTEDEGFTYQDLAEYSFSDNVDIVNHLSMAIALSNDPLYFKLKNDLYFPKPYKVVQEQIEEQAKERLNQEKKLEERQLAFDWLKSFIEGEEKPLPPPVEVMKLLDPVKHFILYRDNYEKKKLAEEIIKDLNKLSGFKISENPIESTYKLFIKMKIFKQDENLSILKYHIPTVFEEKALIEAEQIQDFSEQDIHDRLDLRELYTVTIDDAETQDLDDAISLEITDEEYIVSVHITDVDYFIKPDSALNEESLQRGLSVYLPLEKISMFPEILSEKKMSLIAGEIRPAISFIIRFNKELKLIDNQIVLSVITINQKMSYQDLHELIESNSEEGKPFQLLYDLAKTLQLKREQEGAIDFKNVDVKIKFDEDNQIYLKHSNQDQKSNLIVKEFMILANHLAAVFCCLNQIPAIYVCQEPPDEPIHLDEKQRDNKAYLNEQLKKMKKSEIDFVQKKHFALGLYVYSQATSPIRRFHDLIIHRQLKSFITTQKPYYGKEQIQIVAATADRASKEVKAIERETTRYWLLKYLRQEKKRPFKAIVIRKLANANGFLVEIQEVFLPAVLMTPAHLHLNQTIDITIDRVNPLLDTLFIKRCAHHQAADK